MKIRLIITLVSLLGLSFSAQAERDPRYHFNSFKFNYLSYKEDTRLAQNLEGVGSSLGFSRNLGRLFHMHIESSNVKFDDIALEKQTTELGVGISAIASTKHDLYFILSGLRTEYEGSGYSAVALTSTNVDSICLELLGVVCPGTVILPSRQSTTYYGGLFGYKYYLRPGIQTFIEFKAMLADVSGAGSDDLNTRIAVGARIHPPTNDRVSLGIRLASEKLKFHHSYTEIDASETQFFLRVDY